MKYLLFLAFSISISAEELPKETVSRIANAIFKIENSEKYPYGIKSIPIKGDTKEERSKYARKICENTIRNNYQRWQAAGKREKYLEFLAKRYCPLNDPQDKNNLNKNWLKNLKLISGLDF